MSYDRSNEPCPKCGGETHQDSVDVGVGVIYGPLGCTECGWSEDSEYDLSGGKSPVLEDGSVFDQFGGVWPAASHVAKAYRMAEAAPDTGGADPQHFISIFGPDGADDH